MAWLAKNKKAIDLGVWESPNTPKEKIPTVGELTEHWLQLIAPGVRNSTLRAYKEVVGLRVLEHERLASTPVDKLTPRKVAGWWQDTVEAFPDTAYRNHRWSLRSLNPMRHGSANCDSSLCGLSRHDCPSL